MTKFKVGDTVVQVEPSNFEEHDYPIEKYPVLTINKVSGCDNSGLSLTFEEGGKAGSMAERFRLYQPNTIKDTNPKDAVGCTKPPMSTVSQVVLQEVGVAMLEGGLKYGRHNYRVAGVRASVYFDAAMRHLMAWYEGQDIDPDSGISHITKAIAGLAVLRDADINDMLNDDRPPKANQEFMKQLQEKTDAILKRYPEPKAAFTQVSTEAQ